jgi:hypothetical protein
VGLSGVRVGEVQPIGAVGFYRRGAIIPFCQTRMLRFVTLNAYSNLHPGQTNSREEESAPLQYRTSRS